ncbi:DUF6541 family protein [uncultured Corynebacterium sp.]|uniref:DUF6541 family protein n=1 Tax=uncultured Corynebacterium sp. TaxID=159447 RepID=UPI0025D8D3F3|nr:DUF6541 family protein [uncultured Corynebacterium sp.]
MITALSAVLTALAIFILPGAVVGWCAGMRVPWAAATGVAITAGVWSVLAWWYGDHGIAVTFESLLRGTAVVAAVGLLWRVAWKFTSWWRGRRARQLERELLPRAELERRQQWWRSGQIKRWLRSPRRHGGLLDPVWIAPLAGVIAGFTLVTQRVMDVIEGRPDGLKDVFQGWDVHWHASVLRFIQETGVASSVRMGELQNIETHKPLFYPTGFHTMGAALQDYANLQPVEALNVISAVLPALGMTISAAFLAWIMVGRRGLVGTLAAGLAPVAVAGVFPVFYVEYYTGAWPNMSALAMIGIGAAALIKVPERPITIPAAALTFAGVGAIHPSAMPVVAVIVVLWWLLWKLFVPTVQQRKKKGLVPGLLIRLKDMLSLGVAAVLGGTLMLPQWIVGSGQAGEVSEFNKRQVPDYGDAWQRVLELQSRANYYAPTQWWVIVGAIAGAVVLLLWRRNIWAAAVTGLLAAVGAYSLKHFDGPAGAVAGFLSGLNYNSTHRLFNPLALVATALAAVAAAAVVRFVLGGFLLIPALRRRSDARRVNRGRGWVERTSGFLAIATCTGIAIGLVPLTQTPMEDKYAWAVGASRDGRMVGQKELGAFEWLSRQPGAYEGIIANNSNEGTGWMYPLYNLPSLHRHFLLAKTPKDSATQALLWHPDIIGAGLSPKPGSEAESMRQWTPDTAGMKGDRSDYANISDFAARDLNVKYYIISPPSFFPSQKDIQAQVKGLWTAPGLTPVYKDGATAIFAVNANLTDAELAKARENGESESPDKLPALPEVKFDKKAKDKQKFHRPTKWERDLAKEDAAAATEKSAKEGKPGDKPAAGAPESIGGEGGNGPGVPEAPAAPAPAPAAPYAPAPAPAPAPQVPVAPPYPGWQAPPPAYNVPDPGYGAPGGGPYAPGVGQGFGF